jgi:hypothetical protein
MNAPTKEECVAAFAKVFDGVQPAEERRIPIAEKLEPYRELIMERHAAGFSWRQISDRMKLPPVNLPVSHVTLRELFAGKPSKRSKKAKKTAAPAPAPTPA